MGRMERAQRARAVDERLQGRATGSGCREGATAISIEASLVAEWLDTEFFDMDSDALDEPHTKSE